MRRLLGVLAAAAIVCSLILPPVAAQEVVSAKASRVTIGGTLDFIGGKLACAVFFNIFPGFG